MPEEMPEDYCGSCYGAGLEGEWSRIRVEGVRGVRVKSQRAKESTATSD